MSSLPSVVATFERRVTRLRARADELHQARRRVSCECGPQVDHVVRALHEAADALLAAGGALGGAVQQSRSYVESTIGASKPAPDRLRFLKDGVLTVAATIDLASPAAGLVPPDAVPEAPQEVATTRSVSPEDSKSPALYRLDDHLDDQAEHQLENAYEMEVEREAERRNEQESSW